ncbi:unnamed protein product [Trypanosoma congolense IL3000]|uniref:WGS project CAEQ00000000 data, annotated contig 215 n=1 Tax=Trypanosoma congolense (strain IL3000) TaxID=1068625 RepID=F9WBV6_TRYCI|nr:unnamed protein product [Trypanosoma congolense IL3000]
MRCTKQQSSIFFFLLRSIWKCSVPYISSVPQQSWEGLSARTMRRRGHCSLLDIFVAFRSVGISEGKGVSPFAFSRSHPTAFPSTVGTVQGELNVPTAHVATEIPSCDVVTRSCGGGGMREPVGTLPPYYRPMSLRGVLYEGDLMRQLMEVAAMRHFRSPVWATSAAFTRAGYAVLDGEVGVDVRTCMQNVWLFNIQQTNAPESTPCTTASRLRGMPYNARGRPHSLHVRLVLEGHPSYRRFTSPYWWAETMPWRLGRL